MSNSICEIVELKNNKKIGQLVMDKDKSRYVIAKCKDTSANKSKSEYMTINNNNNYIPSQQNLQVIQFDSLYQFRTSDIEEINILGEDVKCSIIYIKTILFVLYRKSSTTKSSTILSNTKFELSIYYILYRDDKRQILIIEKIEKDLPKFNTYLHKSITNININDDICIGKLDNENYYKYTKNINKYLLYAYIYKILTESIIKLDEITIILPYLLKQIDQIKSTKIGGSFNVVVIKNNYNIEGSYKKEMNDKFEKLLYDCTGDIDMFIDLDKKVNIIYSNNNIIAKYTQPVKKLYIIIKSDNIYIFILQLDGYISKELYKKLFLVEYNKTFKLKLKLVPNNY
jgi:hypothetical protein